MRWPVKHQMIQRFLTLSEPISNVLSDSTDSKTPQMLSATELRDLADIQEVLILFVKSVRKLEVDLFAKVLLLQPTTLDELIKILFHNTTHEEHFPRNTLKKKPSLSGLPLVKSDHIGPSFLKKLDMMKR